MLRPFQYLFILLTICDADLYLTGSTLISYSDESIRIWKFSDSRKPWAKKLFKEKGIPTPGSLMDQNL